MGGAPPPRTGFARGRYPTSSHSATQLSSSVPLFLSVWPLHGDVKSLQIGGVAGGTTVASERPLVSAGRRATRRIARRACASRGGRPYASPHASRRSPRSHLPVPRSSPAAAAGAPRAVTTRRAPVPANAAVYVDATRAPRGRASARTRSPAAGKVLRTHDPQGKIDELVAQAFAESEDAEARLRRATSTPWLGEKVALWARADERRGATSAARSSRPRPTRTPRRRRSTAPSRAARRPSRAQLRGRRLPGRRRRARPASSRASRSSGTEAEFKRDRRRGQGRRRWPPTTAYRKAIDGLEDERLGTLLLRRQGADRPGGARGPRGRAAARAGQAAVPVRQGRPGRRRVPRRRRAARASTRPPRCPRTRSPAGSARSRAAARRRCSASCPATRGLALGSPELGATLKASTSRRRARSAARRSSSSCAQQLGIDLQEDVFSWIGDVAFFARGTTRTSIEGGAVIEVTDPAKAKAAFGKLVGLAQSRGGVPDEADADRGRRDRRSRPRCPARRSGRRGALRRPRGDRLRARGGRRRARAGDKLGRQRHLRGGEVRARRRRRAGLPALDAGGARAGVGERGSRGDPEFAEAKPYLEAFERDRRRLERGTATRRALALRGELK